jgi:hypothetical protein
MKGIEEARCTYIRLLKREGEVFKEIQIKFQKVTDISL